MDDVTLKDGTKVTRLGNVTSADGTTWKLKEGDKISDDGTFEAHVVTDGIVKKDGKPLLVKDCMGEPIKNETSLDGSKVRPDLAVTKKDGGGETALKEGDIVKTDGTILRADGGTE